MIRTSDIDALESVVLDGHGSTLIGQAAASNKVRAFLKSVPKYLVSWFFTRGYDDNRYLT